MTLSPLFELLSELRENPQSSGRADAQFALVESYWHIGRIIVENEQEGDVKAIYGDFLIPTLSKSLTAAYGRGFNETNLRWARQLYLNYPIHHTMCDESQSIEINPSINKNLTWSHYRTLLKITDVEERNFYIQEIANEGWSVRFLREMIDRDFYNTRQRNTFGEDEKMGKINRRREINDVKKRLIAKPGMAFLGSQPHAISATELLFFDIKSGLYILLSWHDLSVEAINKIEHSLESILNQSIAMITLGKDREGSFKTLFSPSDDNALRLAMQVQDWLKDSSI